jgi:hypothetical protein
MGRRGEERRGEKGMGGRGEEGEERNGEKGRKEGRKGDYLSLRILKLIDLLYCYYSPFLYLLTSISYLYLLHPLTSISIPDV